MLERAVACIEPTAQLFTRRFDPPVRSLRVLGQPFWQNGGNDIHIPPWWPLYLNAVRQVPQSPRILSAESDAHNLAKPSKVSLPEGSRQSQNSKRRSISNGASHGRRRLYSHSSVNRQLPQAASNDLEELPLSLTSQDSSAGGKGLTYEVRKQTNTRVQDRNLPSTAQHQQPYDTHGEAPPSQQLIDARQQDLDQISRLGSRHRPNYDRIWGVFVASSDQHGLASAVLAHLANSSERRDLDRALQVFSIMALDDRSKADYDVAVRIAVQMRRYTIAMRFCQDAANKSVDETCRQILLDGCLSQGLWKTAARVWTSFFEPSLVSERNPYLDISSWDIIEAQRNLPTFLSHLCTQLQKGDPSLQAEHTTLLAVVASVSLHMFGSHKIMAFILPRGLFQLLWQFNQLSILDKTHYLTALQTLISSEMPRRRTDLAVMTYRNFRFMFPDGYVSSDWLVSLIRLCDKDDYPLDIFRFWLQERKSSNAKPRRKIYWHLMWAFGRQGDVNSVEELFRESIELLGPPTETKHINPRLYAHAVTGDADAAQNILQEATKLYGLSADINSWNILLFACSRSKEPRRIFAVFDAMDKRQIHPDAVTFETLIGVCSRIGDAAAALSLVEVAKDYNVSVTDDMLAMIVHARCLNDEADEGEKLALSAQDLGIATPIRSWNNLLRHYAFQADFRAIRRVRKFMRDTGVDPDDMTHAAVLTSLVRVGRTQDALKLLRTLHFDGTVTATSFHYSILLHGFAMEKNRNMVEVVYREMEERFPQLSPSAQLAKLHMQAHRGWTRLLEGTELPTQGGQIPFEQRFKLDVQQATSFVDNIMNQNSTNRITSDPQPGFRRRPAYEAVPTIYSESLAGIMALNRQPIQAQKALDHYQPSKGSDAQGTPEVSKHDVQNLTSRLLIASRLAYWKKADELWCKILHLGVETGLPGSSILSMAPSELQMHSPQGMMYHVVSTLEGHGLQVLPAMRFRLSVSLSFYMQALAQQQRQNELIYLVEKFQRLGFALSTKNWNSYIQVLCRSKSYAHRMLAYDIFQEKMLTNTPPWRIISRSKWVARQPNGRPNRLPVSRQLLEHIRPGQMMPTYFTMVFMASVLWDSRRLTNRPELRRRFPQVVRCVERIPLHPDRVRRVIIGRKNAYRDPMKQPRYHRVSRAGVAGSRSVLDHFPADRLLEVVATTSTGESTTSSGCGSHIRHDLHTATMIEGETIRGNMRREKRDELETEVDREARALKRTSKLLERVEQLRRESTSQPLVMHEPTGDPRHITRRKHLYPSKDKSETITQAQTRFLVDRSALKISRSELRERRKAHGRLPLSSMQLGQRLVPPKSRRQQQKTSFSITKARRSDEIRHKVEANKAGEQTPVELRRSHQPSVLRGRKWTGDTPGEKLIDKLLPKRTTVPYDRGKAYLEKRAARNKEREDALAAALASGATGGLESGGNDTDRRRGDQRKPRAEQVGGEKARNVDEKQKEQGSTSEQWKWDQGGEGWKLV